MNEVFIAREIKKEILVKQFNRYFDILEKSKQEPFKNNSWQKIQSLYNSIDENNKENLKEFAKMIMIESITELLAFVDGIATFNGQEYPFELSCNGTKYRGNLQEYLLMDIEENGFE